MILIVEYVKINFVLIFNICFYFMGFLFVVVFVCLFVLFLCVFVCLFVCLFVCCCFSLFGFVWILVLVVSLLLFFVKLNLICSEFWYALFWLDLVSHDWACDCWLHPHLNSYHFTGFRVQKAKSSNFFFFETFYSILEFNQRRLVRHSFV